MLKIIGNSIRIARGDTGVIGFASDRPLNLGRWVFGVKKDAGDEDYLISKDVMVDTSVSEIDFALSAAETDIAPGRYAWGLRHIGQGQVDTYILSGLFEVQSGVVHDQT